MENHTPEELLEHIKEYIQLPVAHAIIDVVDTIASYDLRIGLVKDGIKGISQISCDAKLQHAWKCIADGVNTEKSINELYNYVSNSNRAFYISNEFRKILLSESCLASAIIGYIMGKVVSEKRDCTHEEIIITTALMDMSDFDIRNFMKLVDHYTEKRGAHEIISMDEIDLDKSSCYHTLQLCSAKGIFINDSELFPGAITKPADGRTDDSTYEGLFFIKTTYVDTLRAYIDEVKQLLEFNK